MIPACFDQEAVAYSPAVAASPKYETLPSPSPDDDDGESIASLSYSPISTPSPTPPKSILQLEVDVEVPTSRTSLYETNQSDGRPLAQRSMSLGSPIKPPPMMASNPMPAMKRQVSSGVKRPRPRSPVGDSSRPLAKRVSLPCMQSRSRSDSPLTPEPSGDEDEDIVEEDEDKDGEQDESSDEEEDMELDNGEKHIRSLSRSLSADYPDGSDSDSEMGLEEEPDSEVESESEVSLAAVSCKGKYIDELESMAMKLQEVMVESDLTTEMAEMLAEMMGI
jgi:hypothetical protein